MPIQVVIRQQHLHGACAVPLEGFTKLRVDFGFLNEPPHFIFLLLKLAHFLRFVAHSAGEIKARGRRRAATARRSAGLLLRSFWEGKRLFYAAKSPPDLVQRAHSGAYSRPRCQPCPRCVPAKHGKPPVGRVWRNKSLPRVRHAGKYLTAVRRLET